MAEADKYAPIVKSKNGRPVIMTVDDVELFHKANPEFWAAVQRMPKGYILSTRAERSDKPQVHLHRVPCTVWQRAPSYGPGQTPNHTTRYVKGVSNSILALFQYAQRVYPNRLGHNVGGLWLHVCTCCKGALRDALAGQRVSNGSDYDGGVWSDRQSFPKPC